MMTHAIYRGWKAAGKESKTKILGAGRILDVNTKVRVSNGTHPGGVAGDPFLAWAPLNTISPCLKKVFPSENLRAWQLNNRADAEHMKTLALFARAEERSTLTEERLSFAFIAAALRMITIMRIDIAANSKEALGDFCLLSGVPRADDIWGNLHWRVLPDAPTREIMAMRGGGVAIGLVVRRWHDKLFENKRVVEVWPIEAENAELALFQSSIDRGAVSRLGFVSEEGSSGKRGNDEWRSISSKNLEELVWSRPRQQLATIFSVSDMAIIKRCKRIGIAQPPRGFWQKAASAKGGDLYKFLLESGVIPPAWWSPDMSRRAYDGGSSVEGAIATQ
jgi:hypothetical protein